MDLQIACMFINTVEYWFSMFMRLLAVAVGNVNSEGCKTDYLCSAYVFAETGLFIYSGTLV
jgi:hypothetical protein